MARPNVSTTFNAVDRMSPKMRTMQRNAGVFGQRTQRAMRGPSQALRTLRRLAAGVGVALSARAIVQGVRNFANLGDELSKTARAAGVTVEELQELRFAAGQAGVETSTLDTAMEGMNRRLGELQRGQGSLNSMLENTNPALAEQLRNVDSTSEAFDLLIREMEGMETAQQRADFAQQAFGRSGQDVVQMAIEGADALEAYRQEARDNGLITEEAAEASVRFNDAISSLMAAMRGLTFQALGPLVEKLGPYIEQMREAIVESDLQERITRGMETAFERLRSIVSTVVALWDSGLLPALLAGVAAYKALTTAIAIATSIKTTAIAVQAAWNAVMIANPIGLIIVAIGALIAIVVLLVRNWETVVQFFVDLWDRIKTAFLTGINWIWDNFLRWTPTGLIIQYWEPILDFFISLWDRVKDVFAGVRDFIADVISSIIDRVTGVIDTIRGVIDTVGGFLGGLFGGGDQEVSVAGAGGNGGMIGRNAGMISRSEQVSRSEVDVAFHNLPREAQVRQTGSAPGVNLRYGEEGGSLN